jgi:SAM-dependent methyltransferase
MFQEREYLSRYPDVLQDVQNGLFSSGEDHFLQFGHAEGRWPPLSREEKIFFNLDRAARGLEIGGSLNPLASGPNSRTLDHLDQEGLIAKYSAQGLDTSRIAPVTYVWSGEPLTELVKEQFDWIVASHVVEHVPDLILFLLECDKLLEPGGVLTLAVPDRRYTFDFYRPRSGLASVIDAHLERRVKPSIGSITELYKMHCGISCGFAWDSSFNETPMFYPDLTSVKLAESRSGQYVDTHVWVFTPSYFRLLMLDLFELGYIGMKEKAFFRTSGCEFYIQLSRDTKGPSVSRQNLAHAAMEEVVIR